jgi:outer membrane murein-binding lipoprotein Lpp
MAHILESNASKTQIIEAVNQVYSDAQEAYTEALKAKQELQEFKLWIEEIFEENNISY